MKRKLVHTKETLRDDACVIQVFPHIACIVTYDVTPLQFMVSSIESRGNDLMCHHKMIHIPCVSQDVKCMLNWLSKKICLSLIIYLILHISVYDIFYEYKCFKSNKYVFAMNVW